MAEAQSQIGAIVENEAEEKFLVSRRFLYYINDMTTTQKTQIALFADDTVIYPSSWSRRVAQDNIQKHVNEIQRHFKTWKVNINEVKTELVHFKRKKNKREKITPFHINRQIIEPKQTAKYLGLILDS